MAGATDGDDLAAAAPLVGDRDPRAEARQAILEAVLAAGDHLVVTRTGHNIRTNHEVPNATVLAELRDTIIATLSRECRGKYRGQIETVHPLQRFDDRCFLPGLANRPGPWSFDPGAFAGARAREQRAGEGPALLDGPLGPTTGHRRRCRARRVEDVFQEPGEGLLAATPPSSPHRRGPGGARRSGDFARRPRMLVGRGAFLAARARADTRTPSGSAERALGTLPPGGLGDDSLAEVEGTVDAMLDLATGLGVDPARDDRVPVEVELADGTRVVGTVVVRGREPSPGPALVTYSKASPKQHIAAWLDLVALVASDPASDWRSVVVRRTEAGDADALVLVARGETTDGRRSLARDALEVAVDCYRRGLREPVPLFACLSAKLHDGTAKADDWQTRQRFRRGSGRGEPVGVRRPRLQRPSRPSRAP